jgi:hypothetical protein
VGRSTAKTKMKNGEEMDTTKMSSNEKYDYIHNLLIVKCKTSNEVYKHCVWELDWKPADVRSMIISNFRNC